MEFHCSSTDKVYKFYTVSPHKKVLLWEKAVTQRYAFVSYVRENSDIVDRLAEDLKSYGIQIWLDRNNITPGKYWKDSINNAIQAGAFFISCFSTEFNTRQETYMYGELSLAIDRLRNMPRNRVWFIPVLLSDTEIPPIPISDRETLKDVQAIRLFESWNDGIIKILRAMKLDDPDHPRVLHLIDLIRYHPAERNYAINQLESIGDVARLAVSTLVQILSNADVIVRLSAIRVLGKIGPAAVEAVPALIEALRDTDGDVRERAARALGEIGPAAVEAVPALIEALRDNSPPWTAVNALRELARRLFPP